MTVALMLVTHDGIGRALLETARLILGNKLPADISLVEVAPAADVEALRRDALRRIAEIAGDGMLVMTDMYGSSPANLATSLAEAPRVSVVTGINLPMLIRVLNYAHLPLPEIVDKAVEGGLRSIFIATPRPV